MAGGLYLGHAQLRYLAIVYFHRYTDNAIVCLIHCKVISFSITQRQMKIIEIFSNVRILYSFAEKLLLT